MPPQRASSPARLLAPLALGTFVVALLLIVLGSAGGDGGGREDSTGTTRERPAATGRREPRRSPSRSTDTYTVKRRDTLGGIAEKTGVEVETLQVLNPQLDPQALVAGQKIRLRE